MPATIFLIPSELAEGSTNCLPNYLVDAVKQCQIFFVENLRTARRFLKRIWKAIPIDDLQWHEIGKDEVALRQQFRQALQSGLTIGILSEAGCPGVADPGQVLVQWAQEMGATVKPLVGPSSILLALMASGMNGQCFQFNGYLPIDAAQRKNKLKELEQESSKKNCTQIFIETPYRNNAMLQDLLQHCQPNTRICVAVNITTVNESIVTKTVKAWKQQMPELHKQLCIFLLHG